MKKILLNYSIALALGTLLFFASCSDDERPLPEALTNFEVATVDPEVEVPVKFNNLSFNAAYYVWDYGDGEKDSANNVVNGTHTYDEPGQYTVALRAYNEDGNFTESSKVVSVGERFLTSLGVFAMGDEDYEGNKIVIDTTRGIDLMMSFGPVEDQSRFIDFNLILDSIGGPRSLPDGILLNEDYLLTNEDYELYLLRVDSVVGDNIYRTLLDGVRFNPLNEFISFKYDDGEGEILVPLRADFGYQYALQFEIK